MRPYEQLERELSCLDWVGLPHVVACSSGTAALHLALEAMRLPPGSEVIVPELTMVSCARAVTLAGLRPIFVDCTDDLLMDMEKAERLLQTTKRVRAIMPVHIYGRVCDMPKVHYLAETYVLAVIEDCAEAHGAVTPKTSDLHHYAKCWSFYCNKIVAGEEGGAIAFNNLKHAALARQLRCVGFTDAHDFIHVPRGHNYRMSNLHAVPILASLAKYKHNLDQRRRVEAVYDAEIAGHSFIEPMPSRDIPWVYDLRLPGISDTRQREIVQALNREGVQARMAFKPMSEQPEYKTWRETAIALPLPALNAYRLSREVIYLPIRPDMAGEEARRNVRLLCAQLM